MEAGLVRPILPDSVQKGRRSSSSLFNKSNPFSSLLTGETVFESFEGLLVACEVEVWEVDVFCLEGKDDAKGSALITLIVLWAGLIRSLLGEGASATLRASSKDNFLGLVKGVFELDAKEFAILGLVELCSTDITVREASF